MLQISANWTARAVSHKGKNRMAKCSVQIRRAVQARQMISNTFVLVAGNRVRLVCDWRDE